MDNAKKQSQNFMTGAAILSLSTIIVKIIGMFYKIPLQQFIGENGFAYFTAAYDIYTVLLVISTTGLPVAIPKEKEAACLGAAMIAAVSHGHFESYAAAADRCVALLHRYEPNPTARTERKYRRFCALYEAALAINSID